MICKPCREVADSWKAGLGNANHDPTYCEDVDLDGHGCTCQHDKGVVPHVPEEGVGVGSSDPPAPDPVPDHR